MPIAYLTLELRIEAAHSLKDKRQVLRSVKDRLRNSFNISVAEIDPTDLWQRATLGVVSISHSRDYLEAQIAILMGGRIAEELFLRQMTSGAGNDIERATEIARRMVCEFGMSAALGPLAYRTPGNPWETDKGAGISESMAQQVDQEVRELVMRGYETARQIIAKNRAAVTAMAEELLSVESLDAQGIKNVIASVA